MSVPAPLPGFVPRALQSPSALRADADCRALWGRSCLEGRRTPDVPFEGLPAPPPKAPAGASAVEKKAATKKLKAYNRQMRPALGTAVHAILEGYYLQRTPGAWHAPRLWIDLAVAWETRPGQIALLGRAHLPDPKALAEVWCEVLVTVAAVPGWVGPWPAMGGTPDLVTLAVRGGLPDFPGDHESSTFSYEHHLYDYKTTLDFQYAKTAEELHDHDEQAAIYSLAVMQEHGLSELECTWVYMRTEGAPASFPVHFTMTREHAEARVRALAVQALELEALTQQWLAVPRGFLGGGKRLAMINALPTNESACPNFGGCIYHHDKGGPCRPAKQGLGTAMRAAARSTTTRNGRRQNAKAIATTTPQRKRSATMATKLETLLAIPEADRTFAQKREILKLQEAAGGAASAAEAPAKDVEATGEPVDEPAPAKPASKPAVGAAKPKAEAPADGAVTCSSGGVTVELPKNSPLYKEVVKVCKARAAFDAALAGE